MKTFKKAAPIKLGKSEFVQYASVVGDFNPIHFDLDFAQQFKMPAVVAQGPLVMTLALDSIISENGLEGISGMSARILAPVFPDMDLSIECAEDGKVTVAEGENTVLIGQVKGR